MYDNLKIISYAFPGVAFGAGTTTGKLPIPRGAQMARVLDIFVTATVVFTQVTSPALVQVGDGTTAAAFAQLNVGGLAVGNTISGRDAPIFVAVYNAYGYNSAAGLHDLIATFVAPTGGTPTGTGNVLIVVGYDVINT